MVIKCKFCNVYSDSSLSVCPGCGAPIDKSQIAEAEGLENELREKREEIRQATNEANNKSKEVIIRIIFTFLQLACIMLSLAQFINIPTAIVRKAPAEEVAIDAIFIPIGIGLFFGVTALKRLILRGFKGDK